MRKLTIRNVGISICLVFLHLVGCSSIPKTFTHTNPLTPAEFTHLTLNEVLERHVIDGQVNYPNLATDPLFQDYLKDIERTAPQQLPTPNHRLTFWINAYNAFAMKGIVDGFSPSTLSGRYTYFIGQDYRVGGKKVNLYDLERKILIPSFQEPRIHFAIVCASQSCPKLQSWAYTPEDIDRQLNQSANQFINDPSRNRFDREKKIAYLSKIFDWFEEDFVNHSGSLLQYVARFVQDKTLAHDLLTSDYSIEFLDYHWGLNGIPPTPNS